MPEKDASSIDYESDVSTNTVVLTGTKEITAEVDVEASLYGKNKPRRIKIRRKIVHDSGR
jgi:hypothetical protein